ncbi:MAG: DNA polymerase III subunit beta [Patescibacteria group bacterium]
MKLISKKNDLVKALNSVGRLSSTRSTLPILQNVYLGAKEGELIVRATDLEQTIEVVIEAEVQEEGAVTIPTRLIMDFLQNNSDERITVIDNDLSVTIKSANHQVKLKGMSAQEYPTSQAVSADTEIFIDSSILDRAISTCLFAAANDDTRPILTGLLFDFKDNTLTIVGTDGYRLAKYEHTTKAADGRFIVPKKALVELQRLLGESSVKISISQSQIQFTLGKTILVSRLIDGNFPSFESRIPKSKNISVTGSGAALLNALKVASLFSRDSAYSTKFLIKKDSIEVIAISPQLGESKSAVAVGNDSEKDFSISLNSQYLIDALNALNGDFILEFTDENSPIVAKFANEDNYLYLVMPLRSE